VRRRERGVHGEAKGPAVCEENRQEDEDVSMPRPNKIEIFADENRMSPRWEKGCARGKRKREKTEVYRKGRREGYTGREVEMENRAKEAREASMEKRKGRKGDRRLSSLPSSFLLHDGGRIGK